MRGKSRRWPSAVAICLCLIANEVCASEALIVASNLHRVVNPENASDVRLLCTFALPESLNGVDVVWARLTFSGHSEEVVPLVAAPLEFAWSVTDSWSMLASASQESGAFSGVSDRSQVAANDIAEVEGQTLDIGFEYSAGPWIRSWLGTFPNHGLCIRGLPSDSTDVSTVLPDGMEPPRLMIVFVE